MDAIKLIFDLSTGNLYGKKVYGSDDPLIFCPFCGENLNVYERKMKGYTICKSCKADLSYKP